MKNNIRIVAASLTLLLFVSINTVSMAQAPPPPPAPPSTGHGLTGPQGGSAPIGDGMFLLIGLVGLYAGKKVYDLKLEKSA